METDTEIEAEGNLSTHGESGVDDRRLVSHDDKGSLENKCDDVGSRAVAIASAIKLDDYEEARRQLRELKYDVELLETRMGRYLG